MNGRDFNFSGSTNPLLQIVYLFVGGLLLVGAVLMGAVILAVALAFALILAIVVWIRIWWLRRKLARAPRPTWGPSSGAGPGRVIEVEYTVVDEDDPPQPRN